MKTTIQILILSIFVFVCFVPSGLANEEAKEPPAQYTLEINGNAYSIQEDRPLQIQGPFQGIQAILKKAPLRKFHAGGIQFNYPSYFTWEADLEDSDYKNWTLSGNDFKIMYFQFEADIEPETFLKETIRQFTKEKINLGVVLRSFGRSDYTGREAKVSIGGNPITLQAYQFRAKKGRTHLMVLQDSPPEGKTQSTEAQKLTKLFEESFELK